MGIISKITDPKYKKYWKVVNQNVGGAPVLLYKLDKHLVQLSENLAVLQSKPYSVVADNIGEFFRPSIWIKLICQSYFMYTEISNFHLTLSVFQKLLKCNFVFYT